MCPLCVLVCMCYAWRCALNRQGENVNLVNYTEHASVVSSLHAKIVNYIQLETSN